MAKIVRKDKILSGYNGNLESVKVHNSTGTQVSTSNGVFVYLDGLLSGEREVKKAVLAGEADIGKDVVFIHNSEVMYDERLYKLEDFVIGAGKVARGYRLSDGDIITLTEPLFADTVAVGDKLAVKADGLIGKVADITGAKVVFTVIEDCGQELHYSTKAYAVEVTRN